MARHGLSTLSQFSVVGSLPEAMDEITKRKGGLDLLVLDERFDQSENKDSGGIKVIDVLEAFNLGEDKPDHAVVAVILNESSNVEAPVAYAESGVDVLLHRPLGVQQLKDKLAEAANWISTPPPLVKLLRVIQSAVKKGPLEPVVLEGLEALHGKSPDNLRIGMLLAKALIAKDAASRARGVEIATKLDQQFPTSVFAKRLILEAHKLDGKIEESFQTALGLHQASPTEGAFALAFELAEALDVQKKTGAGPFLKIYESLNGVEALRTRDRRVRLFQKWASQVVDASTVETILALCTETQNDVLPAMKACVESFGKNLSEKIKIESTEADEKLYYKVLQKILELEPGHVDSIAPFVDLAMKYKCEPEAEKSLRLAKEKKKVSGPFYVAYAKLNLAQGFLKEASDMIHAWTPNCSV